ncbi:MAG: exopolysaccharide biosynthesis polyprenyl glycosylphosphotransferase [Acetobacteraceae bacterium]|nr:exopolysaccharide biosynthesis polyprenyl glycosylphosphotransferase [Acetobacteraceae bacterium]
MNEQATVRIDGYPHAPLAEPARRLSARTIRLGVAVADAVQIGVVGAATRPLFRDVETVFGPWGACGLGVLAAALAIAARRALRTTHRPQPGPAEPAFGCAAAAVVAAIGATGAICALTLATTGGVPTGLLGWFAAWAGISAASAIALRHGAARLATLAGGQRILLVGMPEQTEPLARSITMEPARRWRLVGRVNDCETGGVDRLAAMIERHGADVVALAMSGPDAAGRIAGVCERLADQPVRVCLALDAAGLAHAPQTLPCIGRVALADLMADPHGGLDGAAKRGLDIFLGGLVLLAVAPVLAAAALAIRLESPGPVLFRQWRFGLGSRPILVLKFRTMRIDGCDPTGEQRTAARDPRVTRVGRFLRRTSIDELPQLINVLRGDMSLVGPRPHPLHMRVGGAYYFEAVERYRARHLVRPGITGWAQVNGSRGEVDTIEKARRRVDLDLWYLDNWSLALDLRILLRTALGGFVSLRAD